MTLPLAARAGEGVEVEWFLAVECPISNRYVPELNRIVKLYQPKGVRFTAFFPEPALDQARLDRWAREFAAEFAVQLDAGGRQARQSGATVTPEAAIRRDGKWYYRGRIDDRYVGWGKARPEPTRRDVIETLDLLLAKQTPAPRFTKAWGCFIENRSL